MGDRHGTSRRRKSHLNIVLGSEEIFNDLPVSVNDRLEMVSSTEGDEMGVVGRRRDGDRPSASYVTEFKISWRKIMKDLRMAQLVGEVLENVRLVIVVVVQHMVVCWPRSSLK